MSIDQMINRSTFDKISETSTLDRDYQRPSAANRRIEDSSSEQFNDAVKEQAKRAQRAKDRDNSDSSKPIDKAEHVEDDKFQNIEQSDGSDKFATNDAAPVTTTTDVQKPDHVNPAILELQLLLEENPTANTDTDVLALTGVDGDALNLVAGKTTGAATNPVLMQQASLNSELQKQALATAPVSAGAKVAANAESILGTNAEQTSDATVVTGLPVTSTEQSGLSDTQGPKAQTAVSAIAAQQAQQNQNNRSQGDPQQSEQDGLQSTNSTTTTNTNQTQNAFATVIQSADNGAIPISDMKPQGPSQLQAAPEMNAMDKAVAKQIDRAVVQQLNNSQKVLQIRLTPPELGTVKIEIIEQNGRMTVRLQAEDDSVRHSLERALPQLRNDLRSANAPIADIQLTDQAFLMDRHHNPQFHQQQQKQSTESGFSLNGMPQEIATEDTQQQEQGITIDQKGVHGLI